MAVALLGVRTAAVSVPQNPAYRGEEFRSYFEAVGVGFPIVQKDADPAARDVTAEMGVKVLELSDDGDLAPGAVSGAETPPPAPDRCE
jgi:hypothetical protein